MALRIAINGFGRIGRSFLRSLFLDQHATKNLNVVAINEGPCPAEPIDLLFQYDTVMKKFLGTVKKQNNTLVVNNQEIQLLAQENPANLPWKELNIDWVVEASGCFTTKECANQHRQAGAKKVLITAPSRDPDVTIIPGINDNDYNHKNHPIVSLGSCTANCFAVLVKVVKEHFNFQSGLMTTIHSYTNNQVLLDVAHKDPRRARAAALNMVPTKTGAEKVITQLFPELEGKIKACAIRVPTPVVSLVDFTFYTQEPLTPDDVNNLFEKQAEGPLESILQYTTLPLVSSDYTGNTHSAIFDGLLTQCTGNLTKVFAWYDNEFGYSARLKDFLLHNL